MFVAVCDDEKAMQNDLICLLKEYGDKKGVDFSAAKFENGYDLLCSPRTFEIVFMDYLMEGINGIETARKIREANGCCAIIFISAYPEAALDSFEVGTFRFLKKPVDKQKLFRALDDYFKYVDRDNFLTVKTKDGVLKIKLSDIIYAEAQGKHTVIRTVMDCREVSVHLKIIENKLPPQKFVRCHRAYVASFEHIRSHTGNEVLFDNGEKAQLGKAYIKKFKTAFRSYITRYDLRTF